MKCKACKAEIAWVTSTAGRPIPVDVPLLVYYLIAGKEAPRGLTLPRIALVTPDGALTVGYDAGAADPPDPRGIRTPGYIAHFATCPAAAQFRGTPRRQPPRPLRDVLASPE